MGLPGTRTPSGPPGRGTPAGHSQLNLPLLKLLQDRPPAAGSQAGGEFGHGHTPKGLDQQAEPGWEEPVVGARARLRPTHCPRTRRPPPPHLWEFSRELVKQSTLEKLRCRMRCRTTSGLERRLQGT